MKLQKILSENGFTIDKQDECIITYSIKEFDNVDIDQKIY